MSNKPGSRSAFTLIEVVISSALMAIILASGYICLRACFAAQREIEPRVDMLQGARVALALITADLRSACALSSDTPFVGMNRTLGTAEADNMDFGTHHYSPKRAGEGDFCQVSYFVQQDERTGRLALWRRRNPAIGLDPFTGGARHEILDGVKAVRFEYYDGFEWFEEWGDVSGTSRQAFSNRERSNTGGMPEAVRVTLQLDPEPVTTAGNEGGSTNAAPLTFQTVVRLELAAALARGSTSSGAASGGTGNAPATTPGSGGSPMPGAFPN